TTHTTTLSLHDALPISLPKNHMGCPRLCRSPCVRPKRERTDLRFVGEGSARLTSLAVGLENRHAISQQHQTITSSCARGWDKIRSEEHTSELQSLAYLV